MKLLVDSKSDKVLGVSMCGPDSAEIMQVGGGENGIWKI